jgi:RNA polymerase sigma-70 factor, ECF subfamily
MSGDSVESGIPMTPDLESASDDVLIAGIAAGQAEALTRLFRRRQADVYRFALHMTGATALADDVTQDVFLIVMRDAARYEPGRSSVTAWLCGIARNCVRQRVSRDTRLESLSGPADDEATLPVIQPDPIGEMSRVERIAMLRRAVLALPVRYREVVVLCDLEELTYADAADALDCAIGTVRSRLHRARAMLAVRLAALQAGEARKDPNHADRAVDLPVTQKRCMA